MKQYPKYKDSGVQWIGEIPEHWEVLKISRAFRNISSGTTPNTEIDAYYNNGTINWVNTGDLNDSILLETKKKITQKAFDDYSTLKLYPEGSLIVAMYGATIGKVSITAIEATTNQACCVLAESKRILSKYAFYWFLVNKENIVSLAYGGGQPNISQDLIRKLKIIAPPFSEQTAIASFLDHKTSEIDQLIAAKEELIAKLEAQRKAIINEAVTGQAYKTGLISTPNGKEVKFKDSGIEWLGEIPEHWEVYKVSRTFQNISSGTTPSTEVDLYYNNGSINWINTGDLNDGILTETKKKITQKAFDDHSTLKLYPIGSLVIAMYGATIGKVSLTAIEATTNQACCVLAKSDKILLKYAFYWFLDNKENIVSLAYGGGQPNISQELIRKLKIAAPQYIEQAEIVDLLDKKVGDINNTIIEIKTSIQKLNFYKHSLISEAVTGKIDVRDWQKD